MKRKMSDNNTTKVPQSVKDLFDQMAVLRESFASLCEESAQVTAKVITKSTSEMITIVVEAVDGKSWDQIAGKLFGMAIDGYIVNKLKIGILALLYLKLRQNKNYQRNL